MIHFNTFIQNVTPFLCLTGKEQMELHHPTKLLDSKVINNSMLHKSAIEILTAVSKDVTEDSSSHELVSCEKINRKLFDKCQIVLDLPLTLKMKEKQELRKKIIDNGGIVSYMITKMTKFVICVEANINSTKQKIAKRYGIPVVREEYIDTCLKNEKLLDTKSFLISNEIHLNEFRKGKIFVNSNAEQQFRPVEVSLNSLTIYPYEDLSGYELIKPVILKEKVHKISTNNNVKYNFCVIELHASSNKENIDIGKQFCIFVEEGQITVQVENNVESKKFCYYLETAEKALSTYSHLYFSKTKSPYYMTEVMEILNPNIGSPAFQKLQLEWNSLSSHIDKNVLNLMELIWMEAIGELKKYLKHPENIALWKVDEAESILLQIQSVLNEGSEELAEKLSMEFYSILPHVPEYDQPIVSKKLLSQKKDLCQLLRDMVSVSEASGWSPNGHLHAKYKALRCYVQSLPSDSEEFNEMNNCVTDSQFRPTCIKIHNIYAIYRDIEYAEYTNHISNRQLLFHSTLPSNIVGILSRGLNLPKILVEESGIKRTDIGMLGNGIYFTNSASTCIKYSATNKIRNTRFILVSEVALGNVYNTKKFQTSLTNPPDGFDSVHGVKTSETEVSDFQDDEFVIYNPHQQRLKYLIEFSLPDDDVKPYPDISDFLTEETSKNKHNYDNNCDINLDFEDEDSSFEETDDEVEAGLKLINNSKNIEVPLKSVDVQAKIIDLVSEVTVLQVYENRDDISVEAKYVFPLEVGAAVCGFEAFINNKHIVGKIKEKETAHKEYKEAVQKGYGAYLMDEEKPNIFTVSVGNIPPKTTVIIKITYIIELPVINEVINFNIPGSVAPWHKQLLAETQDITSTINMLDMKGSFNLQISVEMPFPIHIISSPTHRIKIKRTETKAVVKLVDDIFGNGFTLCVCLKEIHVPRMWIENHPDEDSQACMMTFYPEFEVVSNPHPEIIIALDASNSMKGTLFADALKTAILCLKTLPHNCYFNIVAFGSVFHELFPTCQIYNSKNLEKALIFLKQQTPELGNTELFRVLKYYQITSGNKIKNIILLSDGNVNNESAVLQSIKSYNNKVRVFTMALSQTACINKHMLQQIANKSGGVFEGLDIFSLKNWKKSVMKQIERTIQASLTNIKIEWGNNVDDFREVIQAPKQITSIFNGCRQIIYGLSTDFNLVKLIAEIDGQEFETVLYTSDLSATEGKMLHTLAAQRVIRDWEDGLLADDRVDQLTEKKCNREKIINFSKKFNLITSLTSFIGVEERTEDEDFSTDEFDLKNDLLEEIDVDILPYMSFENISIQDLDEMHLSKKIYLQEDKDIRQRLSAPCNAEYAPSDDEYAPCDSEYNSCIEYVPCDPSYNYEDDDISLSCSDQNRDIDSWMQQDDELDDNISNSSLGSYCLNYQFLSRDRSPLEEDAEGRLEEEILLESCIENKDKKKKKKKVLMKSKTKEFEEEEPIILDKERFMTQSASAEIADAVCDLDVVQKRSKRKKFTDFILDDADDESNDNPEEVEFKRMAASKLSMAESDVADHVDIVTTEIPTQEEITMSKSCMQKQFDSTGFCFGSAPTYIPASIYRSPTKLKSKKYIENKHVQIGNFSGLSFSGDEIETQSRSGFVICKTPSQLSSTQSVMGKQQLSGSNLKEMLYHTPLPSINDPRIRSSATVLSQPIQQQQLKFAAPVQQFNNEQQQAVKFGDMEITVGQCGIISKSCIMNSTFNDLKEWIKCKGGLPLCDMVCFNLKNQAIKRDEKDLLNLIENIPYYQNIVLDSDNSFKNAAKMSSALENKLMPIYEIIDKNGGFCSEFDILVAGILKKSFQSDLKDAGLKSLGEKASSDIVLMLSTLAVLIFFALLEIQNFQKQNKSDTEFTKLQNFASFLAEKLFKNSRRTLVKALRFVICTHHKYPLTCQSLGFQNNWETFIFDFINEPSNDQRCQVA